MSSVRNHPLEGGGCRITFFQYLTRATDVASVVKVKVPTTVIFEHNCPRAWYDFDEEIGEVRRLVGKDLQASSIYEEFTSVGKRRKEDEEEEEPPARDDKRPISPSATSAGAKHKSAKKRAAVSGRSGTADVIATFTHVHDDPTTEEPIVGVLYLRAAELKEFLTKPNPVKRQGILQRYVIPLDANETVLQASWSPRVCILRRRTSRRALTEYHHPIADRFITFDGPEHHSVEGACSKDTVRTFGALCEDIADHLHKTQHMKVNSMILFFKVNRNAEPCLLWCAGLQFQGFRSATPLQHTIFEVPSDIVEKENTTKKILRETDVQHRQLQTEFMSPRRQRGRSQSPMGGVDHTVSGGQNSLISVIGGDGVAKGAASGVSSTTGAESAFFRRQRLEKLRRSVRELCEEWYKVSEDIAEEYALIMEHERAVQSLMEDTLYLAMSQKAEAMHDAVDASTVEIFVRLPPEIGRYLQGEDPTAALIKAMGLTQLPSGDISLTAVAPGRNHPPPIPTIISQARSWITDHFNRRLHVLKTKAGVQLQIAAVKEAMMSTQAANETPGGTSSTATSIPSRHLSG